MRTHSSRDNKQTISIYYFSYYDTIRYDTIRKKSLTWTKMLSDQLNLAHVARGKNMKKKKLKQTNKQNASAHLV